MLRTELLWWQMLHMYKTNICWRVKWLLLSISFKTQGSRWEGNIKVWMKLVDISLVCASCIKMHLWHCIIFIWRKRIQPTVRAKTDLFLKDNSVIASWFQSDLIVVFFIIKMPLQGNFFLYCGMYNIVFKFLSGVT